MRIRKLAALLLVLASPAVAGRGGAELALDRGAVQGLIEAALPSLCCHRNPAGTER